MTYDRGENSAGKTEKSVFKKSLYTNYLQNSLLKNHN